MAASQIFFAKSYYSLVTLNRKNTEPIRVSCISKTQLKNFSQTKIISSFELVNSYFPQLDNRPEVLSEFTNGR